MNAPSPFSCSATAWLTEQHRLSVTSSVCLMGRRNAAMPSIHQGSPSGKGTAGKGAERLPHGLITPPAQVRERLEKERAKHSPEVYAKHEEGLLNEWTIGYIFDGLCLEVVYRPTS